MRTRLKEVVATTILEAAEEVFGEHGLDARMETIAGRAGVAVGTLYNHFADRQALLHALVADHRDDLLAKMAETEAATARAPFREQLEAMLTTLFSAGLPRARFRALLMQADSSRALERKREVRQRLDAAFSGVLARGRRSRELLPDPEGVQPLMLFGLVQAVSFASLDESTRLEASRAAKAVVHQFLDGAAPRRGST